MTEEPDLDRFLRAQEHDFETALGELRAGRKRTHWIWWVFPQRAGLGTSPTAEAFGIRSETEARAYLAHPVLRERLARAAEAMLRNEGRPPEEVLGDLDAMKLRSSVSLFLAQPGAPEALRRVLDAFYGGEADPKAGFGG
ncbi:uncharacterized protein (DUF1810 family) [Hasllibacter halocynthiae]|uniref:Uncharacterized protein (DUF1810 family) n=1 Tax=Hasllibacter halocynthiae TaxID=595589 RepID=A0A2T0X278_9RHOB|nr:DUF1810 domain-containing protein [Hasllibacter halocynthiae]PRY93056.1 uncharacterized protein (DUF1810 family) [Hasllibacter halocynthiae]